MPADPSGPSWWDVSVCVDQVAAVWGFRPTLMLVPPFKNPTTGKFNAWGVSVSKPARPGQPTTGRTVWAYFGRGGAHQTAPGAAYRALLELQAQLESERAVSEAQASF